MKSLRQFIEEHKILNENLYTHDVNKLIEKLCNKFKLNKNDFKLSDTVKNKNNEILGVIILICDSIEIVKHLLSNNEFTDIIDKFGYIPNDIRKVKYTESYAELQIFPKLYVDAQDLLKESNYICFRIVDKEFVSRKLNHLKTDIIERTVDTYEIMKRRGMLPTGKTNIYKEGRVYMCADDIDINNKNDVENVLRFTIYELKKLNISNVWLAKMDLKKLKGTKITVYKDPANPNSKAIYTTQPLPKECITEIYDLCTVWEKLQK